MDELKHRSVLSSRLWKEAGRPRNGPIFNRYRADKAAYRHGIRSRQRENTEIYTNDLHESLLRKDGVSFWKCWKSKFDNRSHSLSHINVITDPTTIAEHFATHFSKAYTIQAGADRLKNEYVRLRKDYCIRTGDNDCDFDAELVESAIVKMSRGKAAGMDGITAEHLQYSHPLLSCVL